MKPEDLEQNLDIVTRDVRSAFLALCDAAFKDIHYVPKVAEGVATGGRSAGQDHRRRVRALAGDRT